MKVPDSPAENCHTHFLRFVINDDTFKKTERKCLNNKLFSDFAMKCKGLKKEAHFVFFLRDGFNQLAYLTFPYDGDSFMHLC